MNNNKIKCKNFEEGERYKEGKKIVGEDKGEEDNNAKEISASLVLCATGLPGWFHAPFQSRSDFTFN